MQLNKDTKPECAVSSSVPEELSCGCGEFVEIWSDEDSAACDVCGAVLKR